MAGPAVLKIDIIADATKALKQFGLVEDKAKGTGSQLSSVGRTVATAVGTGAILKFGTDSFRAAEESAVATARLESVFASMGDTTGEAAKSAEDYASALSAKIAVDDESIMAAQAQLATFGKVSDETARSAGVFDRATAAAADLAAAGFGSLDSNSVQLGKALQDPVKGIAALGKAGVTFTDEQKASIAAMVEANDTLGAQKLVLEAVESQVGGTAAKTATATGKMGVKFGELQETVGNKLLPVVEKVVTVFTKYMDLLIPLGATILGVVLAVKAYQLATAAVKVVQEAWNLVQIAFNAIMAANPIMLVVVAIALLVAGIIIAYNKVDWFKKGVDAAFKIVVSAFNKVADAAKAVFNWVKNNWPLLLAIITGPIGIAVLTISRNWDTIKEGATAVWNWVKDKFNALGDAINSALGWITQTAEAVADALRIPMAAATEVYNWIKDKFDSIASFISGVKVKIQNSVSGIASAIKNPINTVIRAWNRIAFPTWTIPQRSLFGIDFGPYTIGGWDLPNIPELASGGLVTRSGLAMVHRGETFSGVGRGMGTHITVNVTTAGLGADAPEIQRAVVNALRGYVSRNGMLDVPIRAAG